MTGGAVWKAASAGVTRRLVPTVVIFLVLAAGSAAAVLGLTLATSSNELFLTAFARQHGPQLAVTLDTAKVTSAQLAGTRQLPGVTQAAGPYPETYVTLTPGDASGQGSAHSKTSRLSIPHGQVNPVAEAPGKPLAVTGRASPSGSLDDLALKQGRWATRPGEIDIDPRLVPFPAAIGSTVTVASAPGKPKLTVVGYASSIGLDEAAWVAPGQVAALSPAGAPAQQQMLYTFAQAGTASQVSGDLAGLRHALPARAITSWVSWLSPDSLIAAAQGINTPFVVAFAVIGLVLAVLITASVVAAAVIASYRRIGVLKSIGFTPAQVTSTYLAQIGLPALAGAAAGTALGDWKVLPLVNGGNTLFHINITIPLWINILVPAGMLALTGLAAAVPALRAGRLSAVQAITAGQAPPAGHGYAAHRLAARLPLPRPVTAGLAAPFTRPARSAVTLAAITFGLTAVVLATGIDASLAKISQGGDQWMHAVVIGAGKLGSQQAFTPGQQRAVAAALATQPGTLSYAAEATTPTLPSGQATPHSRAASVPGVGQHVPISAFQGNAAGLGWDITSGHWYTSPGQVVVNTAYPATASLTAGQATHITVGGETATTKITGTVYAPGPGLGALLTSWQTLHGAAGLAVSQYIVALRPGVTPPAYAAALGSKLGHGYTVTNITPGQSGSVGLYGDVDTSLIRLLTILVAVLAGLGVLNAVLMATRERVHDLGIYKAVGMTPRQTIAMVTCWAIVPATGAAIIALPTGMALQNTVMHALALQGPDDELKELGDTVDGLLGRLESAFDAQRSFVANASHELRTPLAMMRTSLDVAEGKSPPVSKDASVLAGKVRKGLDQADRLVESFLVLAGAQRGVMTDLTTVSLPGIASSALGTRRTAAADLGLAVHQHLGDAEVIGSETLLARMVANVVDNAVCHNERGGFVDVTTDAEGLTARVIVESGGPLLDQAKLAQLAQPFRRLSADRTASGNGVGLGLSIVAAIAAAHRGTLDLRARPQGGIRVVIELPHATPHAGNGVPR